MTDLLHNFWFIQFIGAVALLFQFVAWSAKSRKRILSLQSVNLLILAVHFVLLAAYIGAVMNLIAFARNAMLIKKDNKPWPNRWIWFGLFALLSIGTLSFSWQGYIATLPVAAVIISMYALWDNRPSHIRLYMFIACLVWIPYTLAVDSYSGLISQIVGIIGISIGMYRYDRRPN
jgi:NADH:ubiquinone oxidoreductase subunit 6 (subunit J)